MAPGTGRFQVNILAPSTFLDGSSPLLSGGVFSHNHGPTKWGRGTLPCGTSGGWVSSSPSSNTPLTWPHSTPRSSLPASFSQNRLSTPCTILSVALIPLSPSARQVRSGRCASTKIRSPSHHFESQRHRGRPAEHSPRTPHPKLTWYFHKRYCILLVSS